MPLASLRFILHNEASLSAVCRRLGCGGAHALDVAAIARRYGDQVTLDQLEPRLRCKVCGTKGMEILADATRHGPVTLPPD